LFPQIAGTKSFASIANTQKVKIAAAHRKAFVFRTIHQMAAHNPACTTHQSICSVYSQRPTTECEALASSIQDFGTFETRDAFVSRLRATIIG
jgi:hypothetical protein